MPSSLRQGPGRPLVRVGPGRGPLFIGTPGGLGTGTTTPPADTAPAAGLVLPGDHALLLPGGVTLALPAA